MHSHYKGRCAGDQAGCILVGLEAVQGVIQAWLLLAVKLFWNHSIPEAASTANCFIPSIADLLIVTAMLQTLIVTSCCNTSCAEKVQHKHSQKQVGRM